MTLHSEVGCAFEETENFIQRAGVRQYWWFQAREGGEGSGFRIQGLWYGVWDVPLKREMAAGDENAALVPRPSLNPGSLLKGLGFRV